MKKSILIGFVLVALWMKEAKSQVLINAGFENWNSVILFSEPTGYVTSNYASILLGTGGLPTANVAKSTTKHGGTYSAKLNSYAQNVGDTTGVPGLMITGALDLVNTTIKPGFPYAGRPQELRGFYKYAQGLSADSGLATVSLMKYNSVTGSSDVVGVGFGVFSNKATFTSFTVPIIYTNNEMPDSAIIIISTSSSFSLDTASLLSAPVGTVLYIDDLSFFGTASGLESIDELLNVKAYPNPANGEFHIKFNQSNPSQMSYELRDIMGKLIVSESKFAIKGENILDISTSGWSNGVYTYRLITEDGIINHTFIVVK